MVTRRQKTAKKPPVDPDQKAKIVADAVRIGAKATAELWGITKRTVFRHMAESKSCPILGASVTKKKPVTSRENAEALWKSERVQHLRAMADKLAAMVVDAGPNQIREVAGALKILGELHTTDKVLTEGLENERPAGIVQSPIPQTMPSEDSERAPATIQ